MMLKALRFSTALSVVLLASHSSVVNARLANESLYPKVQTPLLNVPICYVQTQSGSTLDLTSLCGGVPSHNGAGQTSNENYERFESSNTPSPEEIQRRIAENQRKIERQVRGEL